METLEDNNKHRFGKTATWIWVISSIYVIKTSEVALNSLWHPILFIFVGMFFSAGFFGIIFYLSSHKIKKLLLKYSSTFNTPEKYRLRAVGLTLLPIEIFLIYKTCKFLFIFLFA